MANCDFRLFSFSCENCVLLDSKLSMFFCECPFDQRNLEAAFPTEKGTCPWISNRQAARKALQRVLKVAVLYYAYANSVPKPTSNWSYSNFQTLVRHTILYSDVLQLNWTMHLTELLFWFWLLCSPSKHFTLKGWAFVAVNCHGVSPDLKCSAQCSIGTIHCSVFHSNHL